MKYEIKKDIISSSFLTAADKKDERPPTVKRKHQVGWATFGIILLINATVYPLLLFGTFLFISAPEIWFVILVAILIAVIVYFTMVGFVRLLLNAYRREGEDDKEHAKANHRKALRLKFRD